MDWSRFEREIPQWYPNAKLGIMISWGAFSVPAYGEPIGELGTVPDWKEWMKHNPYAEWYFNTIRIEGSPAQEHHKKNYNGCDYDDLLDLWHGEKFDANIWAELVAYSGAQYVVPLSKHHDGITLWDAPGTGTRNTVHRGPKRDIMGEIATAVRKVGVRFAVYYSGGLDWSVRTEIPVIDGSHEGNNENDVLPRPSDAAYSMYAYKHVIDLIDRYKPDLLWNDINWPDFSKQEGEYSLPALFDYYYKAVPHGVVNDRWGADVHSDFKTSEYQHMADSESAKFWENCRGVGFSFGYNELETQEHSFTPTSAIRYFVDVVSRGGNLLLNIGPKANGEIPEIQVNALRGIGDWMKINSDAIYGTTRFEGVKGSDEPWSRWTRKGNKAFLLIESITISTISLPIDFKFTAHRVLGLNNSAIEVSQTNVHIKEPTGSTGPIVIEFTLT